MEKDKVYISNVEDIKKERNDSDSSYEEQGLPATKSVAEKKLFRKINYTFVPFVTFILFNQVNTKCVYHS